MSVDLIRYDLLVQDALRDVVRRVLTDVARDGLPGDHHFFIGFNTTAPGVRLSSRLKERHPKDMTIVLQHQFWDLIVGDKSFEVGLSFNGIPERLHVPYDALTGFYDPSVKFGLQFEPTPEEDEDDEAEAAAPAPAAPVAPARARTTSVPATRPAEVKPAEPRAVARPAEVPAAPARPAAKLAGRSAEPAKATRDAAAKEAPAKDASGKDAPSKDLAAKDAAAKGSSRTPAKEPAEAKEPAPEAGKDGGGSAGAQVVRLDAFRKK